jgi:hypothetical protein
MLALFESIGGFTYDTSIIWLIQILITSFIFALILAIYKFFTGLFGR